MIINGPKMEEALKRQKMHIERIEQLECFIKAVSLLGSPMHPKRTCKDLALRAMVLLHPEIGR